MEDLNKHQIILLTLLVSFVTSIATGIMTVSLLQQAPLEVTRNINSIVERTIEKVTPATDTKPQQKEVTTVVVKEEDLVIQAINKNVPSIVRIKVNDASGQGDSGFYGMGLVVSKDGIIVAERKTIIAGDIYTGVANDGTIISLVPTGVGEKNDYILFKSTLASTTPFTFVPATFASADLQLGQTVISLGGDLSNAVSVGRVTLLGTKESGTGTTTTKYISSIDTDASSKDFVDGNPLFNLSGEVVGIKMHGDTRLFTPVSFFKKELNALNETKVQ